MKWFWIILALLYIISPYDLIPGVHGVGWIDDIVVLMLLLRFLSRIKRTSRDVAQTFGPDRNQQGARAEGEDKGAKSRKPPRTPYDVLNLPPDASQEAIKAAYRELANQYHPDKVTHLGKEFQELAEQKFKEIQAAYQQLIR